MPRETVLTRRDLNRVVLARQLLLERTRISIPRALERVGGIQAQYAPSMYIALWSRLDGFERDALTRALERRTVVEATLMRSTIHLVSRRDYWPLALAVREARRHWYLRSARGKPTARRLAAAAARLRARLARDGPLRRKEVEEVVGRELMVGVGLWLDMVRVPPSGTWERRRADLYAAAEDWIGPPEGTAEQGIELLVTRYLSGFGPASRKDVASFTGLGLRDLDPALARLRLRRFRDERGEELLDLPRRPLPAPDTPAPVRLLATWEAMLLAHARRTGVLPEEHRPRLFNPKYPQSMPTFLVDGRVAGTWRYQDSRIRPEPFGRLSPSARAKLREEAEGLERLYA